MKEFVPSKNSVVKKSVKFAIFLPLALFVASPLLLDVSAVSQMDAQRESSRLIQDSLLSIRRAEEAGAGQDEIRSLVGGLNEGLAQMRGGAILGTRGDLPEADRFFSSSLSLLARVRDQASTTAASAEGRRTLLVALTFILVPLASYMTASAADLAAEYRERRRERRLLETRLV